MDNSQPQRQEAGGPGLLGLLLFAGIGTALFILVSNV
jgi:hypothetical protein